MSMDVGGAKGGVKSDINVTPLVDVMLVLLIIMMLVAPMLQKGVDVKLPQAGNTKERKDDPKSVVVAVKKDGSELLVVELKRGEIPFRDWRHRQPEQAGRRS